MSTAKVQSMNHLFSLWNQLCNFLKSLSLTSYFQTDYDWDILGVSLACWQEGDRSSQSFLLPEQHCRWEREKKCWSRKGQIAEESGRWEKLDMGREWPRCLPVLTSCLPRKCQSEVFRKGCCHGNPSWLFPSRLYWDKCPYVPWLVEEGSQFEVLDASWKTQSRQCLWLQNWAQLVERILAQNAVKPVR
jgi:hypothetical protein